MLLSSRTKLTLLLSCVINLGLVLAGCGSESPDSVSSSSAPTPAGSVAHSPEGVALSGQHPTDAHAQQQEVARLREQLAASNASREAAEGRAEASANTEALRQEVARLQGQLQEAKAQRDAAEGSARALAALHADVNHRREAAEKKAEFVSFKLRLVIYLLVGVGLFLLFSYRKEMGKANKWLLAKKWGKWLLYCAITVYIVYDIYANATLIADWILRWE